MARPVTAPLRRLAALAAILATPLAVAQALPDPTRPPAGWGPGESPAIAAPAGARLQMIVRSPGEAPWALIDGQRVRIGERIDGARLIRLTDTEAVLDDSGTTRRLSLSPGLIRPAAPQAAPAVPSSAASRNAPSQETRR